MLQLYQVIVLLKRLYTKQEATVRTEFGETDNIDIGKGVRHGCILSPLLFNIYAENIMRGGFGRMGEWNQHRREDGDESEIRRRYNTARWDQGRLGRTFWKELGEPVRKQDYT